MAAGSAPNGSGAAKRSLQAVDEEDRGGRTALAAPSPEGDRTGEAAPGQQVLRNAPEKLGSQCESNAAVHPHVFEERLEHGSEGDRAERLRKAQFRGAKAPPSTLCGG